MASSNLKKQPKVPPQFAGGDRAAAAPADKSLASQLIQEKDPILVKLKNAHKPGIFSLIRAFSDRD